jgi:hypothetical protein
MDDNEFANTMDRDPAFRAATLGEIQNACEIKRSEPCLALAVLAERQQNQREKQKAGPSSEAKSIERVDDWLPALLAQTAPARLGVGRGQR